MKAGQAVAWRIAQLSPLQSDDPQKRGDLPDVSP